MNRLLSISLVSVAVALGVETLAMRDAHADGVAPIASPENNSPRLGGHLGIAVPMFTISNTNTTIGKDFVTVGIAPGITARLSDKVAIDYEFVAYTTIDRRRTITALVVDPGIVYDLGPVVVGVRAAIRVTDRANFGIIPIINKGFKLGTVAWFVELDLPVFFNEKSLETPTFEGEAKTRTAFTAQLQTGIGF
jgi:hypothetical protein